MRAHYLHSGPKQLLVFISSESTYFGFWVAA